MSVYRETDSNRQDKKVSRESSVSRKIKRDESKDRRPIVTQEKPMKSKSLTNTQKEKERTKTRTEKVSSVSKTQKRLTDGAANSRKVLEKNGKSSKEKTPSTRIRSHESIESKSKKEAKLDASLEKRIMKQMELVEREAKLKAENRSKRSSNGDGDQKRRDEDHKSKSKRDRTRTRTLSPTEVKQLVLPGAYKHAFGDVERRTERENSKREEDDKKKSEDEEIHSEEDLNYEDDFEDYESDFEEDEEIDEKEETSPDDASMTSVNLFKEQQQQPQRPQKLTPDMMEQWRHSARQREIENIKKSILKENIDVEKKKPATKTEEEDSDKENAHSGPMVDFSKALRKQKMEKEAEATRRRGQQLLSMISLDAISYSIMEIPAIPYDEFMKIFGKSNTKQVYLQTKEDDLEEEIQTDEILMSNKWTQCPPDYLRSSKEKREIKYILTKEERLGVGGDYPVEEDEITIQPRTDRLPGFLSWASQMILTVLERKSGNFLSLENLPNHSKAMAFGDGFVQVKVGDIPFLKGRSITKLALPPSNANRLLSIHVNKEKSFQKSMLCVWSLRELSKPLKILVASNRATSCCFSENRSNLVFAGLSDGSICLWDLREPSIYHIRVSGSPNLNWTLQSPTYTTAGNLKENGQFGPIVTIKTLGRAEEGSTFADFTPMQICSLEKFGTISIWSVVQMKKAQTNTPSEDLGLAHWGRVKLIKSSSFSVFASIKDEIPGLYITCSDLLINKSDSDEFFVANSLGSVHYCSSSSSFAVKQKFYVPSKQDAIIETTCLELCPFSDDYFLVGCGDGSIRLHSVSQETPLITLNPNMSEEEKKAGVVSLTWMQTRPCVIFALDSLSRIHIWDLGVSDMYPEVTLTLTQKKITCMKLIPTSDPGTNPFVVFGSDGGNIEIHRLKNDYGSRSAADVQNEMKMFLKYVSIL